jgi:hypothetical protein
LGQGQSWWHLYRYAGVLRGCVSWSEKYREGDVRSECVVIRRTEPVKAQLAWLQLCVCVILVLGLLEDFLGQLWVRIGFDNERRDWDHVVWQLDRVESNLTEWSGRELIRVIACFNSNHVHAEVDLELGLIDNVIS